MGEQEQDILDIPTIDCCTEVGEDLSLGMPEPDLISSEDGEEGCSLADQSFADTEEECLNSGRISAARAHAWFEGKLWRIKPDGTPQAYATWIPLDER